MFSFKNFFDRKFYIEEKQCLFSEMAQPLDIVKLPVGMDAEEMDFLRQFPFKLWKKAHNMRHNNLMMQALKEREVRRREYIQQIYPKLLEEFKGSGDKYPKRRAWIKAEKIAEHEFPYVSEQYDRPRVWEFPQPGKNRSIYIKANPKLSRLVAKLETDIRQKDGTARPDQYPKGPPWYPSIRSELARLEADAGEPNPGYGKHGFDLWQPVRLETGKGKAHSVSRGYKFADTQMSQNAISDLITHASHGMFGDLPQKGERYNPPGTDESHDVKWVKLDKGTDAKKLGLVGQKHKDTHTIRKIRKKWSRKIRSAILHSGSEGGGVMNPITGKPFIDPRTNEAYAINPSDLKKASFVRRLTNEMTNLLILSLAERNQIRGPSTPIDPQGALSSWKREDFNVLGEKFPEHTFGIDIALPFYDSEVTYTDEDGKDERRVTTSLPAIPSAKWVEEIPEDEVDNYEKHPENARLGHEKDYVATKPSQGKSILGAGYWPTRLSKGRFYMDRSDPMYEDKKERLMEALTPIGDKPGDYKEIYQGIGQALKSGIGGIGDHEAKIIEALKPDFAQIIWTDYLLMNLGHPSLSAEGKTANKKIKTWVAKLAMHEIASFAQQNLGRGTRRLRNDAEKEVRGSDAAGSDAKMNIFDVIQGQIAGSAERLVDDQKRKGGKQLAAGNFQFEYSLQRMHQLAKETDLDYEGDIDSEDVLDAIYNKATMLADMRTIFASLTERDTGAVGERRESPDDLMEKVTAGEPSALEMWERFRKLAEDLKSKVPTEVEAGDSVEDLESELENNSMFGRYFQALFLLKSEDDMAKASPAEQSVARDAEELIDDEINEKQIANGILGLLKAKVKEYQSQKGLQKYQYILSVLSEIWEGEALGNVASKYLNELPGFSQEVGKPQQNLAADPSDKIKKMVNYIQNQQWVELGRDEDFLQRMEEERRRRGGLQPPVLITLMRNLRKRGTPSDMEVFQELGQRFNVIQAAQSGGFKEKMIEFVRDKRWKEILRDNGFRTRIKADFQNTGKLHDKAQRIIAALQKDGDPEGEVVIRDFINHVQN